MPHLETLTQFHAALFGGPLPEGVISCTVDPAKSGQAVIWCTAEQTARRFDVYRNNVHHSLTRALATRFPVVERVVGPEFFAAMAPVFLAAHGPSSPMLFQWGDAFPRFLASFPPLAGLPWLADVARIELARGQAYHAADATPLPPEALARAAQDAGQARLVLHPSVQVVASRHAIVSAWAMNQPGATPAPLDLTQPEVALILRDRRDAVPVRALGPGDHAFVMALHQGLPLLAAAEAGAGAEAGQDPGAILYHLAQAGALVGLTLGDET